ncbi:MAG: hypothetical protein GY732_18605 [Gammaproteobacteria bacterium]|nr:hypothetical protein [Gammaproteobacteria bacterium]
MQNSGASGLVMFGDLSDRTLSVKVADMNGDGLPDIIAGNSETANFGYYQIREEAVSE